MARARDAKTVWRAPGSGIQEDGIAQGRQVTWLESMGGERQ